MRKNTHIIITKITTHYFFCISAHISVLLLQHLEPYYFQTFLRYSELMQYVYYILLWSAGWDVKIWPRIRLIWAVESIKLFLVKPFFATSVVPYGHRMKRRVDVRSKQISSEQDYKIYRWSWGGSYECSFQPIGHWFVAIPILNKTWENWLLSRDGHKTKDKIKMHQSGCSMLLFILVHPSVLTQNNMTQLTKMASSGSPASFTYCHITAWCPLSKQPGITQLVP